MMEKNANTVQHSKRLRFLPYFFKYNSKVQKVSRPTAYIILENYFRLVIEPTINQSFGSWHIQKISFAHNIHSEVIVKEVPHYELLDFS